jgi:hypothetical protein
MGHSAAYLFKEFVSKELGKSSSSKRKGGRERERRKFGLVMNIAPPFA